MKISISLGTVPVKYLAEDKRNLRDAVKRRDAARAKRNKAGVREAEATIRAIDEKAIRQGLGYDGHNADKLITALNDQIGGLQLVMIQHGDRISAEEMEQHKDTIANWQYQIQEIRRLVGEDEEDARRRAEKSMGGGIMLDPSTLSGDMRKRRPELDLAELSVEENRLLNLATMERDKRGKLLSYDKLAALHYKGKYKNGERLRQLIRDMAARHPAAAMRLAGRLGRPTTPPPPDEDTDEDHDEIATMTGSTALESRDLSSGGYSTVKTARDLRKFAKKTRRKKM